MIRKLKSGGYRLYSRKKDRKTGRRRNLGIHFIGRDLKKRLVTLHVFAGLLQPLRQGSFHNALAHLGHHDVRHLPFSLS